jgi:ribosome-associated protein
MSEFIDIRPGVRIPLSELSFTFARSGGPGGQNVNKVSTRVDLLFDVEGSVALDTFQKASLRAALGTRIGRDGILRVQAQESRSQWTNRQVVVEKFRELLTKALRTRKKRVASAPTKGSKQRRFAAKKKTSRVKQLRGRVTGED